MKSADLIYLLEVHGDTLLDLCYRVLSNLFFKLVIDKFLVIIVLSGNALLPLVITCGVSFTECGDTKNAVLDYGWV